MDNTYNDEFKMRSFTKEENEAYDEFIKTLSAQVIMIEKEKYNS